MGRRRREGPHWIDPGSHQWTLHGMGDDMFIMYIDMYMTHTVHWVTV